MAASSNSSSGRLLQIKKDIREASSRSLTGYAWPGLLFFGSRSMPKEEDLHAKPTGEWNHYRITALDGSVTLEVNGHVVTAGSQCTPAKGYLCLESAGSEVHFRNFRIWELPVGSHAADENRTAHKATSHKPLYNGLDLDDWNVREGQWKAEDWRLILVAFSERKRLNRRRSTSLLSVLQTMI